MELSPDQAKFLSGSVGSPGICFLGNTSAGVGIVGTRVALCLNGVSNFGANDTGVCFNAVTVPVAAQSISAALTNNIGVSGTSTLADWTSLTVYATDAAAIKAACYQGILKLGKIETALRNYGLCIT